LYEWQQLLAPVAMSPSDALGFTRQIDDLTWADTLAKQADPASGEPA
jgi:hypothetical protein